MQFINKSKLGVKKKREKSTSRQLFISYLWWIEDREKWYSLTWSSTLFELKDKTWKKLLKLLVDYWAFQWSKDEKEKNKELPENLKDIDVLVVTHAHLDHIWRIPYLVKKWFKWKIYMTSLTLELAKLNWKDTISIAKADKNKASHLKKKLRDYLTIYKLHTKLKDNHLKKHEKKKIVDKLNELQNKYDITLENVIENLEKYDIKNVSNIENVKTSNDLLFDEEDIQKTLDLVSVVSLTDEIWVDNLLKIKFFNAGHIEGSVLSYLEFYNENWWSYKCLIAQDLWRYNDNPLDETPSLLSNFKVNYIQLETTYAGRNHPELKQSIEDFINAIENHEGPILIPAFAIQRTQFVVKLLLENIDKFKTRQIYLTSEFAKQVSNLFVSFKREKYEYLLDKRLKFLSAKDNLPSKKLNNAIIVWSSWMLQWWSIERWAKLLVQKPNTKVIFTWYQGEWTRWREIIDWKEYIVIDWKAVPVKCSYEYIKWFSSHADTEDLIHFLNSFKKWKGEKIKLALTHWGENRYKFKYEKLQNLRKTKRKYDIFIPNLKDNLKVEF